MIIGIDVDGVLFDLGTYQLETAVPYFRKKYGLEIKNPKGNDIIDMFDCTKEQREKYWTKYIWKYCLKLDMTKGAAETSKRLREDGHTVYIITGRAHTTESGITGKIFRWMLVHWLKNNKFEYDKIFYVSEKNSAADKYDICISEKVDILIDDKPDNILKLKDIIKVCCYPAAWNVDITELDEYRVESFEEFYTICAATK